MLYWELLRILLYKAIQHQNNSANISSAWNCSRH